MSSAARAAAALVVLCSSLLADVGVAAAVPGRPDLVVTSVASPARAEPGELVTLRAVVRNTGRRVAPGSRVAFYLSEDATLQSWDRRLPGSATVPGLKPGRRAAVRLKVRLPLETGQRRWVLLACADAGERVRERSERNCRAAPRALDVADPFVGTLSGTLHYVDEGSDSEAGGGVERTHEWRHTIDVRFAMDGAGPRLFDEEFVDDGTSYTVAGSSLERTEEPHCTNTHRTDRSGGGPVPPSTDGVRTLGARFTSVGRRHLRVQTYLRFTEDHHVEQTGQGEFPCGAYQSAYANGAADVASIELERVGGAGEVMVYRPVSWEAQYAEPSDWDRIEGELRIVREL